MAFKMAMSRVFSMTIRMSVAMMLSAATITIRVMVKNMSRFSSFSAEKSDSFISIQVMAYVSSGKNAWIFSRILGASNIRSTLVCMRLMLSPRPKILCPSSSQIRAVLEAAAEHLREGGRVSPEIMIPQVCTLQELKWVHGYVTEIKKDIEKKFELSIPLEFGTMVEVVRACMRAGRIAELAEFVSFGTNDLTQATFSFSREDAENKFLPLYEELGILQNNPFEVPDIKGVGRLMKLTVKWKHRC